MKAAEAERAKLDRHRQELLRVRESLRAELERIEGSLAQVSEREDLLDRLVGVPGREHTADNTHSLGRADDDVRRGEGRPTVLRGPDIRREAVRVLIEHPGDPETLHYRDWYARLKEAGFAVGGKDPLATFLTQLSRSPAVRKSTQAGVYELDRDARRRLKRRRDEVRDELRELTTMPSNGAAAAAVRARRTQLNAELGRVERALEEVESLFETTAGRALAA